MTHDGPVRTLIAEDEPAARRHVARLIRRHEGFDVVAEAATGPDAIAAARAHRPDLVLLDIQMPGADGFDVVRALSGAAMPLVVFITAYDAYAVRAFEVHAIDYLLKPFDDGRFSQALGKARAQVETRTLREMRGRIEQLVAARTVEHAPPPAPGRLAIRTGGGIAFVASASITHVTADGYCALIHTAARAYHVRESLLSLAERLPAGFARVHRSAIVNLAAVQSIEPLTHGESRARLAGGAVVKISRTYRAALAPLFAPGSMAVSGPSSWPTAPRK